MRKYLVIVAVVLVSILTHTLSFAQKKSTYAHNTQKEGVASFYHNKFNGRKTATGEVFRNTGFTAASNHFKLGSYVKVTNLRNNKVVYVKINDRMGHPSRVLDLTHRAAKDLNFVNSGTTKVKIEIVAAEEGKRRILAQQQGVTGEPIDNSL